jgi:hypothetical protein
MHSTQRAAAVLFAAALLACDQGADTIMSPDPSYDLLSLATEFLPGIAVLDPFAHGDDHGVVESARGGGHVHVDGEWRTFAFTAKNFPDETTKGQFQLQNRATGLKVHGEVTCLVVDGNTAYVGAIITHSNVFANEGQTVVWIVRDNGEGSESQADQISGLRPTGLPPGDQLCRARLPQPLVRIESGNIQVTDAQ